MKYHRLLIISASIVLGVLVLFTIWNGNQSEIRKINFTLIDTESNETIPNYYRLHNGITINLTSISSENITIVALTKPENIGSLVFKLNKSQVNIENTPPYSLLGYSPLGNYISWNPEKGKYNLTVIPYSEKDGKGQAGTPISFIFHITFRVSNKKEPLVGQIIVNPETPGWFKKNQGESFFLCGPGDPEDFLYRGILNSNGTRSGDQMKLINKIKGTGANSIYLQAVRSHGGDGEATHNPFIENDPKNGLNYDIINQWEEWFHEMDINNIVIFFFLYDDGAILWDTGDIVGEEENLFINEIVNRFEHHKNLIWVVTEEFQGRYSEERISRIAAEIRLADDHNHVISVHHSSEQEMAFPTDPNIDQYAIQYYWPSRDRPEYTREELHDKVVEAFEKADGRYNLNMAEAENWGTGEKARKKSWAIAMAGAYSMVLGMDIENTSISDLEDCGKLVRFMESTDFNQMSPNDELGYKGTEYILANPGNSYIAYSSSSNGTIGIKQMSSGVYNFTWLNIPSGATINQDNILVYADDQYWEKPASFGEEIVVYIRKTSQKKIVFPQSNWVSKRPEALGVNSSKLNEIVKLVGGNGLVIKDGYLIKTWGNQNKVYYWASSSKPVISTLLFFAVQEGKLESVDSLVEDWGWDLKEKDEVMTFRHLANMISGYARPEAPGEAYAYNDRAIQLYYLTMERVFNQTLNEAAMERLHSQIHLEGNQIFSKRGRVLLTMPDFARICWLWTNKGNWDGTQIIEKSYFETYLAPGVPENLPYAPFDHFVDDYLDIGTYGADDTSRNNAPGPGIYGFNWWFNAPGLTVDHINFTLTWPDAPRDTFMSRGLGDAHTVMIPSLGIVIVTTESDWGPAVQTYPDIKSTNDAIKILVDSIL